MGCVSGKTNEQRPNRQPELKPYIHQQPHPSSQPVESSPHPIIVPEVNHNSNYLQAASSAQKHQPVHSSLQNQHNNNIHSAIQPAAPQVLPTNSNIKISHHSGIKQEDIKIAAGEEATRLVSQDPKQAAGTAFQDLVVTNGDKKASILIEQNIKEEVLQIQESRKQGVEYFMRQINENEQEAVHSEGGANFLPVIKGINFQIHIN